MISTRRFGAAEVTLLSAGRIFEEHPRFPQGGAWCATAELDDRGRVVHGLNTAVVRVGEAVVVIDPAFFETREEAAGYFDAQMAQGAEEALARIGLVPGDVTHVVVTHAHRDHYWSCLTQRGGEDAARFAGAEHLVPAADWEPPYEGALLGKAIGDGFDGMREPDFVARLRRYLGPVERAGRLTFVAGDREVCPGVSLVWTGGETEGHVVVRVDGGDGTAFWYLGDLIHYTAELGDLTIGPTRLDAAQLAQLTAGRERVFAAMAGEDATAVYTHARFPGWGRVERPTPDTWAWRWDD